MADRTVNVKLKADVAQYMAAMRSAGTATGDLDKAARDLRKAHNDEEAAAGAVATAEARLSEIRADGKAKASQLAAAQDQLSRAYNQLEIAQDNTRASNDRFVKAQSDAGKKAADDLARSLVEGLDQHGGEIDSAAEKVAKRTEAKFSAMKFTALSAGLPAAAAVGAAGAGIALAAVPALFLALGVSAVMSNQKVAQSFNRLGSEVVQDTTRMASSLVGPVSQAAVDLGTSFRGMEPQITAAFNGSAPAVKILTSAVTDFAERAMPGLVTAVQSSHGPLEGLRSIMGQTGQGISDMFTNMSAGSMAAGASMVTVGGIVQDLLGFVGNLLAQLANGSGGPLASFRAALQQVESALLAVTANGGPVIGFLTGFTGASTGALSVVNLLAHALSILPAGVSQIGGSVAAAGMLLSKFGVDVGAGFRGLGTAVSEAGTGMTGAAKAGTKVGTALGGLVAGALNPATLAVAGLGIGLSILGQRQQEAAAAAAGHTDRVNSLAAALRASNGAIDSNVRATAAESLANFKVSDGMRNLLGDGAKLGISQNTLTDAYLGNVGAQKTVVAQLEATVAGHKHEANALGLLRAPFDDHIRVLGGLAYQYDDTGLAAQELLDNIQGEGSTFSEAAAKNRDLAAALTGTGAVTTELSAAMDVLRGTAASTSDRIIALKTALDILAGRTPTFEEGIKAGNDALRTFTEGMKGGVKHAEGFGKALLNADGTVNTFTKNGSSLQGLATGLETSFVNAASGIDQMVRRGVPLDVATKKVNDSLGEQRNRFVAVAEKMGLSAVQAKALADKYGLIPNDISTLITADMKQAQAAINALPAFAAGVKGAVVVSANTDPATGQIQATVQYADGSTGMITITGNKDPATGKVMTAVQFANGQTGTMTVAAAIEAAKNGTLQAVRFADGSTGFIQVGADTGGANAAIDWAARGRTATIYVQTQYSGTGAASQTGPGRAVATGGLLVPGGVQRFAKGGLAYATSGLTLYDLVRGGLAVGPGTGTSDDMLARVSNGEFVNNEKSTKKNLAALKYANAGGRIVPVPGFADGGMVQAEDGSWVSSSFYDHPAVRRNFQSGDEARAIKAAGGHLVTADGIGTWVMPDSQVQQAISSGSVVQSSPSFASQYSMAGDSGGGMEVHVYLGNREITDIVRTEVRSKDRQTKRAVTAGAGRAR
jgi:hypothetical protein